MPDVIKIAESTAGRKSRQFMLLDDTGNAITGATVTGRILRDGVETVAGGTFAEVSAVNRPGLYEYTPSTTEMATSAACSLRPIATGAIPAEWPFSIIGNDVYATSATAPTNFSSLAISGSGEVTTGTVSSSALTSIASSVWSNATRTLSSFGTLVADVWASATRTLSASQTFSTTGSVGSVTGAVGSVTGSVGSVTGAVATVTALGTQAKADVTAAVPTATAIANATRDIFGLASSVADTAPTASSFVGAAGLSAVDDFYKGMFLLFEGGVLDGVSQKVTGYVGATRTFTVAPAFPAAPADGDPFLLIGRG